MSSILSRQYLDLIHPRNGRIFIAKSFGNKQWTQQHADTADQALSIIDSFEAQQPTGVFISQAVFDTMALKREAQYAETVGCFFADFDVGISAGKFALKSDAIGAINRLETDFLPCTAIVDSGGGYHAYWRLNEPISAGEWLPLAQRFKHALQIAGIRADPTVSADLARVLRVPGTSNRKTPTHRPCLFVKVNGPKYGLADYTAALKTFETRSGIAPVVGNPPLRKLQPPSSIAGARPATPQGAPLIQLGQPLPPPPSPDEVQQACPAIAALALTGGQTEEA